MDEDAVFCGNCGAKVTEEQAPPEPAAAAPQAEAAEPTPPAPAPEEKAPEAPSPEPEGKESEPEAPKEREPSATAGEAEEETSGGACPGCGTDITDESAIFCPECGTKVKE